MKHSKKGEGNTLGDMLNPEVRNILEKLKRLSVLTANMEIPKDKATDLEWLVENLPQMKYVEHKHFQEAVNLVSKLQKINKKK
jgi:proteasome assembly chaperone (PAC2) family protein